MKTEREIRKMIDELMDKATNEERAPLSNPVRVEALCNQIDALLWVVGDRSGKEIG